MSPGGEDRGPAPPMTWIKCTNEATRRLYDADIMDEPVRFSANGTANVPADVAARMVEHYDGMEYKNDD